MKYYTIETSDDISVIGAYPQVVKEENYNLSSPISYWNVSWDKIPDFTPDYRIKLNDAAKPTSLLNTLSGFYGLTVDKYLKNILERFNLPEHNFYPIEVRKDNQALDYYWFHFVDSLIPFIDFKNTLFEKYRKFPLKVMEELRFTSINELHKIESRLNFEQGIRIKDLKVNNNFPKFDVISLWNLTPHILISENLKKTIENIGFTGLTFLEYKALTIFPSHPNMNNSINKDEEKNKNKK
jgi:hypothetical protein